MTPPAAAPLLPGAPRFARWTLAQFVAAYAAFSFTRRITAVHMHHTQVPTRRDWQGERTIQGMWDYHTKTNLWSTIGQHVTVAPDGGIWQGRDWNRPPASNTGDNGTGAAGPFMFEIVGDFDRGRDQLDGWQRVSVLGVITAVQHRGGLPVESLQFHRALGTTKTCPGTGLDYARILEEVRAARGLAAA